MEVLLSTNALYNWRVNATNGGGTSAYSSVWSFTTAAIPAGLVTAYAFDEGGGTKVSEASAHGLTGTIVGGIVDNAKKVWICVIVRRDEQLC